MSQKTNPISLRLQKNNQNFNFPWFADFFFTENYHYGFEIENYITAFLRETQYSKAFFSAKGLYRKFSVFLFIQDNRSDKKEKQISFKSKPYKIVKSSKSYSNSFLFKLLQERQASLPWAKKNFSVFPEKTFKDWVEKNFYILPFFHCGQRLFLLEKKQVLEKKVPLQQYTYSCIFDSINKKWIVPSFVPSELKEKQIGYSNIMKLSFRKQIRNNFLRVKQNYPYYFSCPPLPCGIVAFGKRQKSKQIPFDSNITKEIGVRTIYQNKKDRKQKSIFKTKFFQEKHFVPFGCISAKQISFSKNCVKPTFSSYLKHILLNQYGKNNSFAEGHGKLTFAEGNTDFPFVNSFAPVTVNFEPIRFIRDRQNVISLLDQIIILLENRVPFTRIKSKLFKDVSQDSQIRGVRICCSGRLGGRSKKAQKAKMQSDSWGETSLNAFSSKLLFASKSAYTSYGKVGVKLWLCFHNDRF